MVEQAHVRCECRAEVFVVGQTESHNGFQTSRNLYFILGKDIVGGCRFKTYVVALAVQALLYQLQAGREFVPAGQPENASQSFIGVVGTFARFVVGLFVRSLSIVVF